MSAHPIITFSFVFRKEESPKKVTSPKMTDYVVRPKQSDAEQPIKKRAVLFSMKKDGNWIAAGSSPPVTSAVASLASSTATVSTSSEDQVTIINPIMKATCNSNVEVDQSMKSKTNLAVGEEVENEPRIEMKTSQVDPASTTIINNESERDARKISNVTVKEGKKYATLISIKKAKE